MWLPPIRWRFWHFLWYNYKWNILYRKYKTVGVDSNLVKYLYGKMIYYEDGVYYE